VVPGAEFISRVVRGRATRDTILVVLPVLPLVALLLLLDPPPDASLKETAARLREITARVEKEYDTASSEQLALVRSFERNLRDWIEPQLPPPSATSEVCQRATADLKTHLQAAAVFGLSPNGDSDDTLEISRPQGYPEALLLRLGVRVPYGADEVAYLYEWRQGSWKRTWASERDQNEVGNLLSKVEFSPADARGNHLLVTITAPVVSAGCWHGIGYRLERVGPKIDRPVRLLDGNEVTFCDGGDHLRMEPDGFLIEIAGLDMFPGYRRTHVLHYKVSGNEVKRVPPLALQPQDFVHEWLQHNWNEARDWSQSNAQESLRKSHQSLGARDGSHSFGYYAFVQRCQDRHRWQIAVDQEPQGTQYFLVRETTHYQFVMMDVSAKRQLGCPGETQPTREMPTLFGAQRN
jgi:hypothetical protein